MSVFMYSYHCTADGTNHLWSCCRLTIQIWVICIQVFMCVCVCSSCHDCVCVDENSNLRPPLVRLHALQTDSYMWYFALGGALYDHWPIYWHTQEVPRCHGARSRRCKKKKKNYEWMNEGQLAKVLILRTERTWASAMTDSCVVVDDNNDDRKVPVWYDRAVKYLEYGSFPDSSYEMPGGVLSYICCTHTKLLHLLLLLLPLALKTELPIKYSAVHMRGKHSSLPA